MATLKEFEYMWVDLPYYEVVEKINGLDFRKYYVFDIRDWHKDKVALIFDDFLAFQQDLLCDDFFSKSRDSVYPRNLMLYFIVEDKDDYAIDKETVKNDMHYAFKDFISYSEFVKLTENENIDVQERSSIYTYQGNEIEIRNFNLIYGLNGSGKTDLLRFISDEENLPLFDLYRDLGTKEVLAGASEYIQNLKQIVEYCRSQSIPLLLDDIGWNAYDDRNKIKIVDQLYEYSHENNVIFTSCQRDINSLVKRLSHDPNIIEL